MDKRMTVYARSQNRLALGIVRAYVNMHPEVTLDDLNVAFPKSLNPDSGVKENFIDVTKVHEKQGKKWKGYFVKDSELITLIDGTRMAVVSMWTRSSLGRLQEKAEEEGIRAEQVDRLPGEMAEIAGYVIEETDSPMNELPVKASVPEDSGLPATEHSVHEAAGVGGLLHEVAQDIRNFLKQCEEHPSEEKRNIFFNEFDLQMHLSIYLTRMKDGNGRQKYDDVDVEYFIPIEEMKKEGYDWDNKAGVNIDIVVEKEGEYVPIELKYPTDTVNFDVKRFGEVLGKGKDIIKHQGASNLVMYNFWKDVKRIEVLKKRFKSVRNGITLFLTNDPVYLKQPRENAACVAFSMSNGIHAKEKHWQTKPALADTRPDFDLSKEYTIRWNPVVLDGVEYHYNLLEI